MIVQIEITTRCNFECFYCAGRDMPQDDMDYAMFERILDDHIDRHGVPREVSLQGEGEPTLHKRFFHMAAKVLALGSRPYTITNGTHKHPEQFVEHFDVVGVSIDTLDEKVAERIGRFNLARTIRFVEALSKRVRVNVHSVAIARDLQDIGRFCRRRGLRHIVQPLQPKPDYAYRYPGLPKSGVRAKPFWCSYLAGPQMRYYALDGTELPCCFIKDTSSYQGIQAMTALAARGMVPPQCEGCTFGQQARGKVANSSS